MVAKAKLFLALAVVLCCAPLPAGAQLRGHGGPVKAIAISADGSQAVSGSFDTTVIRWSLASGAAERVLRFHAGAVNAVAFLQDGRIATSGLFLVGAMIRPAAMVGDATIR